MKKTKKKNKILLFFVLWIFVAGVGTGSCSRPQSQDEKTGRKISHYTCPMHPQIHEDKPGTCPICHMTLVPVFEERGAGEQKTPGFFVSPERQQLIGLRTTMVEKKTVVKTLKTTGRVAFDPDLAIAQREFLEISKNVPSLRKAAISRLKILGMSDEEIRGLEKKKLSSDLYLPEKDESVWVYATLYQGEVGIVKEGMKADISLPSGVAGPVFQGVVRSVDPLMDPVTRSARARIEVPGSGGILRPNTYVHALLKIDLGENLVVPKSAIMITGERQIVFLVHEDRFFELREIRTGSEAGEDQIILEGLVGGERIVVDGTFFVDSESRLKEAVSGMKVKSLPTCPQGEKWDVGMAMCMPEKGNPHD